MRARPSRAGWMSCEMRQNPNHCFAIRQGFASKIRLKGVSAARRKCLNPPPVTTSRILASPACAPSASPTSCDREAGVQSKVEAE